MVIFFIISWHFYVPVFTPFVFMEQEQHNSMYVKNVYSIKLCTFEVSDVNMYWPIFGSLLYALKKNKKRGSI